VRELVYLSKRKLRHFDLSRRRGPRAWVNQVKATIKAFGIGELTIETAIRQGNLPTSDAVITALKRGDRAPVSFTANVQTGQWVQFEAPLSYTTIGKAIVFLDVDEQSAAYPSGGEVRLILHGSAEHLVGNDPPPRTSVDELSEQASARSAFDAEAFTSVFNHFFDLIEYGSRQDINSLEEDHMMSFKNRIRAASLDHVIPTLSDHLRLPHGGVDGRLRSHHRYHIGRRTPLRVCHAPLRRTGLPTAS
jgi:hypothetical protein